MLNWKTMLFFAILISGITTNAQQVSDCQPPTAQTFLEANAVRAGLLNGGDLWWDTNCQPLYQFPKIDPPGSEISKNTIFAGAVWMGGIDQSGQLRLAAMTYRQDGNDFWPGPLDENGEVSSTTCSAYNRFFEITNQEIEEFQNFGIISDNLRFYPAKNNPHLATLIGENLPPNEEYAPFADVNSDEIYNVDDGDFPLINGTQSIFWIFNDLGNFHTQTSGNPIGVEVKATAYAYGNSVNVLDSTTFYRYELTNKSDKNYTDFVFAQWVDIELGRFDDDFVGVDTVNNFAYGYNGDDNDDDAAGYGTNIPIVAVAMLGVPYEVEFGESKLGAFLFYNGDITIFGRPSNAGDYYEYMTARWKNGQHITYGGAGNVASNPPSNFMFPCAPNDTSLNAWSECSEGIIPANRRFVMASKPFAFAPGETVAFDIAVVASFGFTHPCPDISLMQSNVQEVQTFYDYLIYSNNEEIEKLNEAIEIFPNPTSEYFSLNTNANIKSLLLQDLNGKYVAQFNPQMKTHHLDRNVIKSGIYSLTVIDTEDRVGNYKILVQ